MREPATAEQLPVFVEIHGEYFPWSPEGGLDADAVATVENFIWREARRYERIGGSKGLTVDDLVQEGRLGALQACGTYDPRFKTSFLGHAVWRIRRTMLRALRQGPITIPEKAHALLRKTGQVPPVASLDLDVQGNPWVDLFPSDEPDPFALQNQAELQAWIQNAVAALPARERDVIQRRYGLAGGEPEALSAIALTFGTSRQRIHQIQVQAENRLKRQWSLL